MLAAASPQVLVLMLQQHEVEYTATKNSTRKLNGLYQIKGICKVQSTVIHITKL